MAYSSDLAYTDYFKGAADGKYDTHPIKDRFKAAGIASLAFLAGGLRISGRLLQLIRQVFKMTCYLFASYSNQDNRQRLKLHCKLFMLGFGALTIQTFQIAIHIVAIGVGLIFPKGGFRLLQIAHSPLSWITSQEKKIWQHYIVPRAFKKASDALKTKVGSLFNQCSQVIELSMKTIVNEFSASLDSGIAAPLGLMKRFHSFGANPKHLTTEQKKMTPILLLNGNYSHQATFLPFLHALKRAGNMRPVYTINLPSNTVDASFIASKIDAIKGQYGMGEDDCLEIDMVGHSMGSDLIQDLCEFPEKLKNVQIGRAITIGTPFFNLDAASQPKQAFDVIAKHDCFVFHPSLLPKENQKVVDTGHLGLLFHHESLDTIINFLNR